METELPKPVTASYTNDKGAKLRLYPETEGDRFVGKKPFGRDRGIGMLELVLAICVVATLLILAVPGYQRAQTRSKVSRARADLRELGVAIESYMADNADVPLFPTIRQYGQTRMQSLQHLTTPVAYVPAIPFDPFNTSDIYLGNRVYPLLGFDYTWGSLPSSPYPITLQESTAALFFSPYPEYSDGTHLVRTRFWALLSLGPDQTYALVDPSYPSPITPYDPTNGTVSHGDIVRLQFGS